MAAERDWFEKDFYKSLGVAESATDKEITRAYRKLAKELHPDTNPGKEDKFKEVSAAYDVLGDADKRKEYDQVRKMGPVGGGFGGGARGGQQYSNVDFGDFGDVNDLGDIFGGLFGGPRRQRQQRGGDIEAQLKIAFRDAVMGQTTSIQLSGNGAPRTVNVRIPAGVVDKQRIRLKGKGFPGANGGPAGDLYIDVNVLPDPRFTMRGRNITTTVSVPMSAALLGTTVEVPTLDEAVTLKVPGGTQPGTVMRVKGRGVPAGTKHAVGDLLVTIAVDLPKKLTKKQRALVEELARELNEEVEMTERRITAVYVISVFAEIAGVHPQTLRNYERTGLLNPQRTEGGSRRFSDDDLTDIRRIQELTNAGINLEGVKRIMVLEAQIAAMEAKHQVELEAVRRSMRRDLVPLDQAVAVFSIHNDRNMRNQR